MADKNSEGYQEALKRIDELKKSKEYNGLDLRQLDLVELPEELFTLNKLRSLDLDNNQLRELPREIVELKNLSSLFCNNNQLSQLPKELFELRNLEVLSVTGNQIIKLPHEIGKLKKLGGCSFYGNKLNRLPAEIGKLENLELIDLANNQISELPREIGNLKNLQTLYIYSNQLESLPEEISNLKKLKNLSLRGNAKLNIPPEIIEQEPELIFNYYFANVHHVQLEDKRPLKEVKVLLVGQGRVGKTSLVRYLVNKQKRDPNEETTHGIFRTPWKIDVVEVVEGETGETHNVQLNLWDFGGQDIMHATHEFFLTERSLYLYVMDAGLSKEANRLEYWLKKIQTYGQNAPVFIVINKSEANKLEIPLQTLQESYNIQGLFEVSCENGFNIDVLEKKIIEQIGKMPEVFRRLNKNWFAVKEEVEKLKQDYISIEEYRRICSKHQVTDSQSQDTLLTYLNELGVMLNFKEDNTKVLNPEWVTRGVYKLITSVNVRNNKAILTPEIMEKEMESLNAELAKEDKEYLSYPSDKYEYIIKLMKKFELCYEIQGTKDFYIPGRLEEDKPADIGEWNEKQCLGFRYDYGKGFLHESVMSRFIVKTHRLIFERKQWLTGVLLKNEHGNKALVRADLTQGFIKILIDGNNSTRREFLAVLRNHFQDIHADIKLNKPVEEVPLDEYPDEFIKYEKLLHLESANINENHETAGGQLIKVDVNKLLNGLATVEEREKDRAYLQKIREEEKIYQTGLIEGLARREPINLNIYLYTPEREIKPVETKTNLEDFARLQRLESKKELLDIQADSVGSKKAITIIIISLIIHISFFIALLYFIFVSSEGGWDKAEKWTFAVFAGLEIINSFGCLGFFIKTRQDFSWSSFCTWMIERQKTKLYLRNGVDDNEITDLRNRLKTTQP